jgi:hypothetical protein
MAQFVPAHQHAFMSMLVFAMFVAFVGYIVWTATRPAVPTAVEAVDAGRDVGHALHR